MTADIDTRLHNWALWLESIGRTRGASCITGLICDNMRAAALGNVWSGHDVKEYVDAADAQVIERCMRTLLKPVRDVLRMHYVECKRWQIICRTARVRVSKEHFDMVMQRARAAVEAAATTPIPMASPFRRR